MNLDRASKPASLRGFFQHIAGKDAPRSSQEERELNQREQDGENLFRLRNERPSYIFGYMGLMALLMAVFDVLFYWHLEDWVGNLIFHGVLVLGAVLGAVVAGLLEQRTTWPRAFLVGFVAAAVLVGACVALGIA